MSRHFSCGNCLHSNGNGYEAGRNYCASSRKHHPSDRNNLYSAHRRYERNCGIIQLINKIEQPGGAGSLLHAAIAVNRPFRAVLCKRRGRSNAPGQKLVIRIIPQKGRKNDKSGHFTILLRHFPILRRGVAIFFCHATIFFCRITILWWPPQYYGVISQYCGTTPQYHCAAP